MSPLLCCSSPELPLPHREQEQTSLTKTVRLTHVHTHAHRCVWAQKTHLRSRLASFHSRSINLKIWRVNMSCLRSRKREWVRKKEQKFSQFQKVDLKVISTPHHHDSIYLPSLPTLFSFIPLPSPLSYRLHSWRWFPECLPPEACCCKQSTVASS